MKKITWLLIFVMLLTLLGGCHGRLGKKAFVMPETFDTSRQYEITFWAKNDTNITQADLYRKAIADFQALYPNITVNLRLYTDYGRIYNDVITNIATDTTPNVCITYPDHIATYMSDPNNVVALDSLMSHPEYGLGGSQVLFGSPTTEQIIPQFLAEGVINGKQYALPYMRSTEACYVNKTYVEKLGFTLPDKLTWDFVWEVSEAATEKNPDGTFKVNNQQVMIPFLYKSTDNMMIQYLRQAGGDYSTATGEIGIFNDITRDFLFTIADHVKTGAFSTFKISSYPANFLNAGQCIFAVDSTAGATWMGSKAPLLDISEDALVDFETAVMAIPQLDPENPTMISQGPSMCIFNKEDPQEVLASWLFMQFMLTDEIQIAYAQTEGYAPVTSKAQQTDVYQDYLARSGEDNNLYYDVKLSATQLLLDNVDNTFVTPVFNGSASLRDAAGQMIENVAKSIRRKQTVDDAYIDSLYKEVTSLHRLDQSRTVQEDTSQANLGPLPTGSVALLVSLAIVWFGIGLYVVYAARKNKKNQNTH